MVFVQSLIVRICLRDRCGGEKYIPNLTTIQHIEWRLFCPVVVLGPVEECFTIVRVLCVELLDEVAIDFVLLLVCEISICDGEIYSGLDCYVESSDAICCEDENTVVVLKDSEEYYGFYWYKIEYITLQEIYLILVRSYQDWMCC